jgi:ribosomal protein L14
VTVVVSKARPIATVDKDAPAHMQAAGQKVRRGDVRRAVIIRCAPLPSCQGLAVATADTASSLALSSSSRTKKSIARPDGRTIRFDDNACVLLNQKGEMLGSRISGAVSAELRKSGRWGKVISMAPKVRARLHTSLPSLMLELTISFPTPRRSCNTCA